MADLDLRKLRYFVAVAEHLRFGRAAEQLYIAQPVLSRQIRVLEDDLGVRLFERDRRGTALTAAGEQLLADARPLLDSALALRRRAVRAAHGTRTFTVGFMPGLIVTAPVRALAERHPDLDIELVRTTWDDQTAVVRDGRVDVSFVRPPLDPTGLRVRELYTDPRVVVISAGHRLAGKQSIEIADLAGDLLLQTTEMVPEWRTVTPDSEHRPPPAFRSVEEKLEHVAAARGIVVLPLSVAAFYTRPDITYIPVTDIAPGQVSLAWPAERRSPLIDEFAALAGHRPALPDAV
ncbi:LysR family transcriptional regulator [Nocardia sp. SYP-A9097]|uniref:LysR family transcriptional regulator n=1 Tax=Nocardia sp. SYP-A9097 TaxID=2663237 RepID=UPI00129BF8AC|nr:LysR substrate-binding domain-containing protein [Nocardia sp. SYP-A9097]MRH93463.1 LysR family transcriptional regulator [Nocardia sp. SYP-A9097]